MISIQSLYWVMVVGTHVRVYIHVCDVCVEGMFANVGVSVCKISMGVVQDQVFISTGGVWEAVAVSVQYVGEVVLKMRVMGLLCRVAGEQGCLCLCSAQCVWTFCGLPTCAGWRGNTAS